MLLPTFNILFKQLLKVVHVLLPHNINEGDRHEVSIIHLVRTHNGGLHSGNAKNNELAVLIEMAGQIRVVTFQLGIVY